MPLEEMWKVIEGIPNYAVSSMGRVIRTKRGKRGNSPKGRVMSNHDHQGHNRVSLYIKNHQYKNKRVDVLVLSAFRAERPSRDHVPEHLDGNEFNDNLINLRWLKK